jgi:uncharacterized protein YgfB (UPF0149 family)
MKTLQQILSEWGIDDETTVFDATQAFMEWLKQFLHDFPEQFPRSKDKNKIENNFILKRLRELEGERKRI